MDKLFIIMFIVVKNERERIIYFQGFIVVNRLKLNKAMVVKWCRRQKGSKAWFLNKKSEVQCAVKLLTHIAKIKLLRGYFELK
jgi:hypothetical protein